MDFVTFEALNEEPLPLPQPLLLLPLKPHLDNLGLNLGNFNNIKNLWSRNQELPKSADQTTSADGNAQLNEQYANLTLQALRLSHVEPETAAAPESRSSALSKRLSRALNTSLTDSQIRDYFTLLETKVAEIEPLTDPGASGSAARKNLRGDVEADLIRSHTLILHEYARIAKNLESVGLKINSLDSVLSEVNSLLAKDSQLSESVSAELTKLTEAKLALDIKNALLTNFRNTFALNEYEQFVLTQGDINDDFFAALSRAEEINEKCLLLLALDNPHLGQQIMTQTSGLINKAMDKVLLFCNRSITNLYLMNNKSRTETLHLCLRYLKGKHMRFGAVIDTYVESRVSAVLEDFANQTDAQKGDQGRGPRKVYLTSHDPARFVSDILAYVHSVVVNETEIVNGLFDVTPDFQETTHSVVNRVLTALTKQLKLTVEQVLLQEQKVLQIYQIFCHLDLYRMMFAKLSHAEPLLDCLDALLKSSTDRITNIIQNKLATTKSLNQAQMDLSSDLQPPEWIIDFYSEVLPMIDAMSSKTVLNLSKEEHDKFVEMVVDEPISIFYNHLSGVAKSMGKKDVLVFKQNFLDLVLSKILPLPLLSDKAVELNRQMASNTEQLTKMQLDWLLHETGLYDYYNVVNMICPLEEVYDVFDEGMYEQITENKLFTAELLGKADEKIQVVLPNALLETQQALMRVNLPVVVADISRDSLEQFVRFYECFRKIAEKHFGSVLTWSAPEAATLLGVEKEAA